MGRRYGFELARAVGRIQTVGTVIFLACLLILATAAVVQNHYRRQPDDLPASLHAAMLAQPVPSADPLWFSASYQPGDPHLVSVVAAGDVMMGDRDIGLNPAIVPGVDAARLIGTDLAGLFRRADLSLVNLEGALYDGAASSSKNGCERCYAFRSPGYYADVLASLRVSAVSLANNHSGDYGAEGRLTTIAELKKRGIGFAGLDREGARFVTIALRDGRQAAVIGFAPNDGTLDINQIAAAAARVRDLKRSHALVIVWFHGGGEGWDYAHVVPGHESFAGEDRGDVVGFCHAVVEAGADLVIGSGPHVPRAIEIYRGHLIAYSLGNFWTYEGVSVAQSRGLAPILEAWLAPDGALAGLTIHSARQSGAGVPHPDPASAAARTIYALTRSDFPATAAVLAATPSGRASSIIAARADNAAETGHWESPAGPVSGRR